MSIEMIYSNRIHAILNRWRETFVARDWPTTEVSTRCTERPPFYSYGFDAQISLNRIARVEIVFGFETDMFEDGEVVTTVYCYPSINMETSWSDHVNLEVSTIRELLGDDEAFERKFRVLDQVAGTQIVSAIDHHCWESSGCPCGRVQSKSI